MKKLTNQQLFNKAVGGLYLQGFEQAKEGVACVYEDGQGRRCAAGQLMDDDWDGWRFKGTIDLVTQGFSNVPFEPNQLEFVRDLQRAHDGSAPYSGFYAFGSSGGRSALRAFGRSGMRSALRAFALKHDLEIPAVLND